MAVFVSSCFLAYLLAENRSVDGSIPSLAIVSSRTCAARVFGSVGLRSHWKIGPTRRAVGVRRAIAGRVGAGALCAGVTLYVAVSDLVPEVNREGETSTALTVFAGVVLYIAVRMSMGWLSSHRLWNENRSMATSSGNWLAVAARWLP
jgi:hypothetical protein